MNTQSTQMMMIAGEPSGDIQAALLLERLRILRPAWSCFGIGGPRMIRQGFDALVSSERMGVIGFVGVARKMWFFRQVFHQMVRAMRERRPQAVILVDYPGFNLRFAERAKKQGVRVIYYIAPQVWAWGEHRVNVLRRAVDLLVTVFPFEEDYFRGHGVPVVRVGHPLLDIVHPAMTRVQFRSHSAVPDAVKVIALLPGSRPAEVKRHLPVMLDAVSRLASSGLAIMPIIARAEGIAEEALQTISTASPCGEVRITSDVYSLLGVADAAIVKSGTGTVECALLGTPFVAMYKTSRVNFLIARRLVKTAHLAMVNLIAGKTVVPEFIQEAATGEPIARAVRELLTNTPYRELMQAELALVRQQLGPSGGATQAARAIVEFLEGVPIA